MSEEVEEVYEVEEGEGSLEDDGSGFGESFEAGLEQSVVDLLNGSDEDAVLGSEDAKRKEGGVSKIEGRGEEENRNGEGGRKGEEGKKTENKESFGVKTLAEVSREKEKDAQRGGGRGREGESPAEAGVKRKPDVPHSVYLSPSYVKRQRMEGDVRAHEGSAAANARYLHGILWDIF